MGDVCWWQSPLTEEPAIWKHWFSGDAGGSPGSTSDHEGLPFGPLTSNQEYGTLGS